MNNRERKEFEEQSEEQENYVEEDDEHIERDVQTNKAYPSDNNPQDFYPYKKYRTDPDARTDFPGLIDKDTIYANVKGELPSLGELNYLSTTIQIINERLVKRANTQEDAHDFEEIVLILKADFKFKVVGSRAHGDNREAMLDNQTNIRKELMRKNEQKGSMFGLGR